MEGANVKTGGWSTWNSYDQSQYKSYPTQPPPIATNTVMLVSQLNGGQVAISQPGMPSVQPAVSVIDFESVTAVDFHNQIISIIKPEGIEPFLVAKPALANMKGFNGQTALHRACLRGDMEVIQLLLRYKADPNAADDFDETPMHFACKRANIAVLHLLLQSGANPRAEDRAGKGALHHVAHGGSVRAAHYLLEVCGLNSHIRDRNLSTPLHLVCMHGHVEAFKYFVKKERSDVFAKDAQGNTPLHVAALSGNGWTCFRLLQIGGHKLLHELNLEGCTALELAKRGNQPKYADAIKLLSYYSSIGKTTGRIVGPRLAWFGLLLLPFVVFPACLALAYCFDNRGPVTLLGVILILIFRGVHSHRMEHITRWPSPGHIGMFVAGMLYTALVYGYEILPYILGEHKLLVVLSMVLSVVMTHMFVHLMRDDPGVCQQPRAKNGHFFSVLDIASGQIGPEEFCVECEFVPPLDVTHCKLCEKCFHRLDHHCLYLYRCIAVNNHRLFVLFNFVVEIAMAEFLYTCYLYVYKALPAEAFSDYATLCMTVFTTCPAIWGMFVLNCVTTVWGLWLLFTQLSAVSDNTTAAHKFFRGKRHSNLPGKQRLWNVYRFLRYGSARMNDGAVHFA